MGIGIYLHSPDIKYGIKGVSMMLSVFFSISQLSLYPMRFEYSNHSLLVRRKRNSSSLLMIVCVYFHVIPTFLKTFMVLQVLSMLFLAVVDRNACVVSNLVFTSVRIICRKFTNIKNRFFIPSSVFTHKTKIKVLLSYLGWYCPVFTVQP